jgi:hypothetical protein
MSILLSGEGFAAPVLLLYEKPGPFALGKENVSFFARKEQKRPHFPLTPAGACD